MTRPISGFAVGIAFSYAVIARIVNQIVDQPYMVHVASDVFYYILLTLILL